MRIALCGAIGAAITVTVAWGFEINVRPFAAGPGNLLTVWSHPSGIGEGWSYWGGRDCGTLIIERVRARFSVEEPLREEYLAVRDRLVPAWSVVRRQPAESDPWLMLYVEDARGWPLLALRSQTAQAPPGNRPSEPVTTWGIALDKARDSTLDSLVLPLRPIWTGFAIDTLLYAGLAFGLFICPGMLKHAVRRRRGRCQRCGYDLRGSSQSAVCPECGNEAG